MTHALTQALTALADPTRRSVLQRLAHGPATVGQLAALFPVSRAAVSQHLRVLREAGLVRPTSSNRQSPYELAPEPLLETEAWLRRLIDTCSAGSTALRTR
jgi:DNA-binding transcriptional ArsR family regulator